MIYYFNELTNESCWERPSFDEASEEQVDEEAVDELKKLRIVQSPQELDNQEVLDQTLGSLDESELKKLVSGGFLLQGVHAGMFLSWITYISE
jgi:hypothetical protein